MEKVVAASVLRGSSDSCNKELSSLPSIASVFKSVEKPVFLAKGPKEAKYEVGETVSEPICRADAILVKQAATVPHVSTIKRHCVGSIVSRDNLHMIKRPVTSVLELCVSKHRTSGAKLVGQKRTRLSGKDRVKRQRNRGHSGIDSEFRVWRSETEMQMRQQFD